METKRRLPSGATVSPPSGPTEVPAERPHGFARALAEPPQGGLTERPAELLQGGTTEGNATEVPIEPLVDPDTYVFGSLCFPAVSAMHEKGGRA